MNPANLFSLLLVMIFESLTVALKSTYDETKMLIRKLATAKVKYLEAAYFKTKKGFF